MEEYLKVEEVCKIYKLGDQEITALKRATFSVKKVKFVASLNHRGLEKPLF
ncbi:MAG: hypothetical protein LBP35_06330 [Candidatus Ancillula trichonymphae]|nr:hypothetical protein [Candidatus Ancillula trichonymphae]